MVEAAGAVSPSRARQHPIFRAPQAGCASRTRSTASSSPAAVRAGLSCGRRERSAGQSLPSSARVSHLYAVFALISNRRHSARRFGALLTRQRNKLYPLIHD